MDDPRMFIGSLMQTLVVLVPILTVCYIALMGQVRKQIREDVAPVTDKQELLGENLYKLEAKVAADVAGIGQQQELLKSEMQHVRQSLSRLENMVERLLRSGREPTG